MKMGRLLGVAFLILSMIGCATPKFALLYPSLDRSSTLQQQLSLGVFRFEDIREENPDVAFLEVRMIDAVLPYAFIYTIRSEQPIAEYVTGAFGAELERRGYMVSKFPDVISFEKYGELPKDKDHSNLNAIILGRIRFFRWVQPGFAGLLFQAAMPKGKAYVDIDLLVLDPKSLKIRWAGRSSATENTDKAFNNRDDTSQHMANTLGQAIRSIIMNPEFAESLSSH